MTRMHRFEGENTKIFWGGDTPSPDLTESAPPFECLWHLNHHPQTIFLAMGLSLPPVFLFSIPFLFYYLLSPSKIQLRERCKLPSGVQHQKQTRFHVFWAEGNSFVNLFLCSNQHFPFTAQIIWGTAFAFWRSRRGDCIPFKLSTGSLNDCVFLGHQILLVCWLHINSRSVKRKNGDIFIPYWR